MQSDAATGALRGSSPTSAMVEARLALLAMLRVAGAIEAERRRRFLGTSQIVERHRRLPAVGEEAEAQRPRRVDRAQQPRITHRRVRRGQAKRAARRAGGASRFVDQLPRREGLRIDPHLALAVAPRIEERLEAQMIDVAVVEAFGSGELDRVALRVALRVVEVACVAWERAGTPRRGRSAAARTSPRPRRLARCRRDRPFGRRRAADRRARDRGARS